MLIPTDDLPMARIERLLQARWPTGAEIAPRLGQALGRLREQGQVLGCWDSHLGQFRYPPFQFHAEGGVKAEVVALLAVMLAHPEWSLEDDPSGWRKALWLHEPHPEIAGFRSGQGHSPGASEVPVDVLEEDPWAVLALAQAQLAELEVA